MMMAPIPDVKQENTAQSDLLDEKAPGDDTSLATQPDPADRSNGTDPVGS
jgi:hypothetical protein